MSKKATLGLAGALLFLSGWGQLNFNYSDLKKKYKDDEACYLSLTRNFRVGLEEGKIVVNEDNDTQLLLLSEKSSSFFSKHSIYYYQELQDIYDIEACSYVPNRNKYKKIKVKEILSQKPVKEGVFYDDYQEKYFYYPGVTEGAVTSLRYSEKIKDPHFLGTEFFNEYVPVLKTSVSIEFPKEVEIRYIFMGDSSGVHFSRQVSGKKTTYTWTAENRNKLRIEEGGPSLQYYAPHIILYVSNYTVNGKTVPVLSDVHQLYRWYHSLVKDVNAGEDTALMRQAKLLTAHALTDEEKIKNIFYWVQDNIKYIAFEDGLGGFVPREASAVYEKRYGDCKDKSSIMSTMLNMAGVPAHLCWIGTRDIPYSYRNVPLPSSDNHMIVAVQQKGRWVFLDGTAEHLPYPLPTGMIQDKEGLIALGPDSFAVVKVPVVPAETNFHRDSVRIHIEGNEIKGKGYSVFGGFSKTTIENVFDNFSMKERNEKLCDLFKTGNNKCTVDSLHYSGLFARDSLLSCHYALRIPDYLRRIDNEVFINLNLGKWLQGDRIEADKLSYGKENDYQHLADYTIVMEIPLGYKLSALPENSSYEDPKFGFDIRYAASGNTITLRKKMHVSYLLLEKKYFDDWNKMIDALNKAYQNCVVLVKK